jgi:hypothetical protein
MFQQQAENELKDREWAMRHAPGPERAVVLPFSVEPVLPLLYSRTARAKMEPWEHDRLRQYRAGWRSNFDSPDSFFYGGDAPNGATPQRRCSVRSRQMS